MVKKIVKHITAAFAFRVAALVSGACGWQSENSDHSLDAHSPETVTIRHYYNGVQQEYSNRRLPPLTERAGFCALLWKRLFPKSTGVPSLLPSQTAPLRRG